jgi:hypothetical protein
MEELTRYSKDGEFGIKEFPECPIVVLEGTDADFAADLTLHLKDLQFAANCLAQLNDLPADNQVLLDALWLAAVSRFARCFMHGKRHRLDRDIIYTPYGDRALQAFDLFHALRSEHFAHDVNGLTAVHLAAVLAPNDMPRKVVRIITTQDIGETLSPAFMASLAALIDVAIGWVEDQYDALCDHLRKQLEKESYEALLARPKLDLARVQRDLRAPAALTKNARPSRKGAPSFDWLTKDDAPSEG